MNLMDEKFAKSVFISAASFAVGCISTSYVISWAAYQRAKKNDGIALSMSPVISFTDNPDTNAETARSVMEQTLLPTLLAAQQMGWSPEVFENNIKTQFDMTSKIMISLYHDGQNENLSYEEFKEKIKSEIEFIVISARDQNDEQGENNG